MIKTTIMKTTKGTVTPAQHRVQKAPPRSQKCAGGRVHEIAQPKEETWACSPFGPLPKGGAEGVWRSVCWMAATCGVPTIAAGVDGSLNVTCLVRKSELGWEMLGSSQHTS